MKKQQKPILELASAVLEQTAKEQKKEFRIKTGVRAGDAT